MTTPDKPRRRWLRFSLRSLLLLVLVIALSLAWMIHKAREQGIAVAALEKMGCLVYFDSADIRSPTILVRLRKMLGEDERNAIEVNGNPSQITDAGLVHLKGLTRLHYLNLVGRQVTDSGLAHLREMTQLGILYLDGTQVTDAGLVDLRRLINLTGLHLQGTQVTDAGLVNLQGLTKLLQLDLRATQVTDAGLVDLQGLTKLQELDLGGTQVTNAGIQRLQKALPKCTITLQP